MPRAVLAAVNAVAMAVVLSACQRIEGGPSDLIAGQPRISDAVWMQTQDVDTDVAYNSNGVEVPSPVGYYDNMKYVPSSCFSATKPRYTWLDGVSAWTSPSDGVASSTSKLTTCIQQMKMVISRRYEHWRDAFNSAISTGNAAIDIGVVGASLIGAGIGGITSQALNAFSGFLTSTKAVANNDFLFQKSAQIIITQMNTDRAKWDTIISGRLQATEKPGACSTATETRTPKPVTKQNSKSTLVSESSTKVTESSGMTTTVSTITAKSTNTPVMPYCDLATAWADLEVYSQQGSFANAMTALTNTVSAQSAACQAENVNTRKAATSPATGGAAGSPTVSTTPTSTATATAPCPTAASTGTSSAAPTVPH
jgi:hypothetical protein